MLQLVFLFSCLVLTYISSAPLSSDGDSWSVSSYDEDMKPPAVFPVVGVTYQHAPPTLPEVPPTLLEAPSGVIVEVKDTKTNSSLSFTIFILAEDETDASGSSSESSEESQMHKVQPLALLPQTETETSNQPIRREYEEENVSSEEMMSDQPMLATLSEDFDSLFLNTTESSVSPIFSDDFNISVESSEVIGYFNDKNNSRSEHFTDDSNSNETSDPLSDDFNNSTESTETNDQPARNIYRPVPQSSSSRKTSYSKVASSRRRVSEESMFGSRLGEVFRSIQKVVDLLSVNRVVTGSKGSRKVLGSTPASLTGKQAGFTLSSDESNESSESVSFSRVSPDPKNQTRVPDSDESLEATSSSFQQGTGPRDSKWQLTGSTRNIHSDLSSPDPDRKQVQDTSVKSIQVDFGVSLKPVGPDEDVASPIFSTPRDTVSKESSRSFSRVNISLNSDSSEESQEVVGLTASVPGLYRVGSPAISSSSEEVLLVLSSPKTPNESGHFTSESEDSSGSLGLDSDSGNNYQSAELYLYPIPTSDSKLSPEFNFNFSSEISREKSEESLSGEAKPDVNYRIYTASSEANMDTKPDSLLNSAADLSLKATSDSSNDVSFEAEPPTSLPSVYVSSGASHGANADAGSESSVEKKENAASTEATADSGKLTENFAGSRASIGFNANAEREKAVSNVSTDAKPDFRKRPLPRRKRPFRSASSAPSVIHTVTNLLPWKRHPRKHLKP